MSETLQIFGEQFTNVAGIKAYKPDGTVVTFRSNGFTVEDLVLGTAPRGEFDISGLTCVAGALYYRNGITRLTGTNVNISGKVNVFGRMEGLLSINLRGVTQNTSSTDAFRNCSKLKQAVFQSTNKGSTGLFYGDSALEVADLIIPSLEANTFYNDNKLATVILRRTSLTSLSGTGVFSGLSTFKSSGTGGTLYVPQALISTYQNATNWSTILGYANNQILPIEGSIYETQYADGTPIE